MPSSDAIMKQSQQAYKQWAVQWRKQATEHSKYKMLPLHDFENTGVGKALLLVANGYTFEEEIETIKKYKDNVDIMACDKTIGHLLSNGIVPKYCIVCDANVDYEKYLEPWKDQLSETIMFNNVCGNPKWSEQNWKERYFFVNKDIMENEKEFCELSGCPNTIAAATNVSNAMVVFATQCDNDRGRVNFFGYDKYLLIGFDYSWSPDGNYYAFDRTGDGKRYYMKHVYAFNNSHDRCYTSNNLLFSAQWLESYIKVFHLPIVQCGKRCMLASIYSGPLEKHIQYLYKPKDSYKVRDVLYNKNKLVEQLRQMEVKLKTIAKDHYESFVATV